MTITRSLAFAATLACAAGPTAAATLTTSSGGFALAFELPGGVSIETRTSRTSTTPRQPPGVSVDFDGELTTDVDGPVTTVIGGGTLTVRAERGTTRDQILETVGATVLLTNATADPIDVLYDLDYGVSSEGTLDDPETERFYAIADFLAQGSNLFADDYGEVRGGPFGVVDDASSGSGRGQDLLVLPAFGTEELFVGVGFSATASVPAPVPLPAGGALMLAALGGLVVVRRPPER